MKISIGNEQFFGFEDSMCRPILNDISVTFTILMQYLGLINRALFFYILLTIKLSEIIAIPALPFPASIWTKIPCLASIEFPQKCISKFVTLVLPSVVITRRAPATVIFIFLLNVDRSMTTFPFLRKTSTALHLCLYPFHCSMVTFLRPKNKLCGPDRLYPTNMVHPLFALQ